MQIHPYFMKRILKSWIQGLQINIIPDIYKKRYFRNLGQLTWKSIKGKNIENETLLIQYLMEDKDSVFIDIGANLGQYIFMAERIIPKANIHAFEPHPYLNQRLRKIFKGIHVHPFAVSRESGQAKFKIPFFDTKEIHTRGTLKTDYIDNSETTYKLIDVEIVKLDEMVRKLNPHKISMIKIDVEGAEMDVIEGAWDVIRNYSPVLIIEIEQRHHTSSIHDFISKIETTGDYKCYYFDTERQLLKGDIHQLDMANIQSLSNHAKNRLFINNFIFLPKKNFNEDKIQKINEKIAAAG